MLFNIFKKRRLKRQELKNKLFIVRDSMTRELDRLENYYKYKSKDELCYNIYNTYCYIIDVLKDIEEEI